MGRGSSGAAGGGGGGGAPKIKDFPEAFGAGKDYQAVGGVNHQTRTASRTTQREWDQYSASMNNGVTPADEAAIMTAGYGTLRGYVRTSNSFAINAALYDPKNAGKTDAQIFKRKADRDTVKALDKSINNNVTPADGSYTRFSSPNAVQATFGLSNAQMQMLQGARNMTPQQLTQLNRAMSGSVSHSKAYTSTSANRSLNAFSDPTAPQSRGFIFERRINVPKGTKAYAPRQNAQESEVIFGRNAQTRLTGISVSSDGHIVLHEMFDGYK